MTQESTQEQKTVEDLKIKAKHHHEALAVVSSRISKFREWLNVPTTRYKISAGEINEIFDYLRSKGVHVLRRSDTKTLQSFLDSAALLAIHALGRRDNLLRLKKKNLEQFVKGLSETFEVIRTAIIETQKEISELDKPYKPDTGICHVFHHTSLGWVPMSSSASEEEKAPSEPTELTKEEITSPTKNTQDNLTFVLPEGDRCIDLEKRIDKLREKTKLIHETVSHIRYTEISYVDIAVRKATVLELSARGISYDLLLRCNSTGTQNAFELIIALEKACDYYRKLINQYLAELELLRTSRVLGLSSPVDCE